MSMSRDRSLTFILAGGRGQRLEPLTAERPKPAVPMGGVYRLIDFTLSNCVNSGLLDVHVLVQHLSAELIRHVHEGWRSYFSPVRGETLQVLPPQFAQSGEGYRGTADALFQSRAIVEQAAPRCVVVLSGDHVYKMDYRAMVAFHEGRGADLTVGAVIVPRAEGPHFGVLEVGEADRITGFQEKPAEPVYLPDAPDRCLASMGVYVFRPSALLEALWQDSEDPASLHDCGRDLVPRMAKGGRVYAYDFRDANRSGGVYWRDVGTLDAYYQANMDLIAVNPEFNLYDTEWPIRGVPSLAPPPKFVHSEPDRTGMATDSIVSPGCIVSGARVVHSVLGPWVRLHSRSLVEDSVLFENVDVGRHARIRRAIIDVGIRVPEGEHVGHDLDHDRSRFVVSPSGIVVVSREAAREAWPA